MGTSISQSSPRSSKWKPVHMCYTTDKVPEDRVLSEVWKAADNPTESVRWSNEMKSEIIYSCYETIKSSVDFNEALSKFNATVIANKSNSIVAEFAKRAIPAAFQGENVSGNWAKKFFSEVTNYVISRDTSGFVGENYRNKTVKDLGRFKERINETLSQIIRTDQKEIKSQREWNTFVDSTIAKIKSNNK